LITAFLNRDKYAFQAKRCEQKQNIILKIKIIGTLKLITSTDSSLTLRHGSRASEIGRLAGGVHTKWLIRFQSCKGNFKGAVGGVVPKRGPTYLQGRKKN
jgi:hypothetical protein